jgi:tripartite-type tricarboxylate transporter receptor subunit TctC
MQRETVALAIALASALAIFDMPAQAQSWPSRPIRIILPNPPGGTNDILARMLQAPLQEILGQPIVVENRAGGSNIIATDAIVRSPPDGYTIGTIISVHASNVALQPKLPYDSIKDITPIAFLGYVGNIVVVHPRREGQLDAGVDRAGQGQPGDDSSRIVGHWYLAAFLRRVIEASYRRGVRPRAVSRWRPGHQ